MPKLRRLSGAEVVLFFETLGFTVVGQRGSHVKPRCLLDGERQTLVVPAHRELDTGTSRAIMRQAGRYIPEAELRRFFQSES